MRNRWILLGISMLLAACQSGGSISEPAAVIGRVLYEDAAQAFYSYADTDAGQVVLCRWQAETGWARLAARQLGAVDYAAVWLAPDGERFLLVRQDLQSNLSEIMLGELVLVSIQDFLTIGAGVGRAVPHQFYWLPDGQRVLFNTSQSSYAGGHLDDLHLLDLTSNTWSALLPPGEGGQLYPSPEGGWLAVVSPVRVTVVDTTTLETIVALTLARPGTFSDRQLYPAAAWQADHTLLLAAASKEIEPGGYRVFTIDHSGEVVLLSEFELPKRSPFHMPAFSPDAAWLVFEQDFDDEFNAGALHLVSVGDGRTQAVFTSEQGQIGFVEWLDNESFVFWDGAPQKTWRAGLDGSIERYHAPPAESQPRAWMVTCAP